MLDVSSEEITDGDLPRAMVLLAVPLVASLLQFYAVRLPIAAAGALYLGVGVHAVFWAVTVSNVAMAVGLAAYYRHAVAEGMLDRACEAVATG